ncbi:hypothetical protein HK096_004531 [Nowakowskiella sp. JEL0078]|nr:hypothetical protein HK096_004531 [Nowakowskiella sp. JEL0078]
MKQTGLKRGVSQREFLTPLNSDPIVISDDDDDPQISERISNFDNNSQKRKKYNPAKIETKNKTPFQNPDVKIFAGIHANFVYDGTTATRFGILINRFREQGGILELKVGLHTDYIVTDFPISKAMAKLKIKNIPEYVKLVSPDWISRSIYMGKLSEANDPKALSNLSESTCIKDVSRKIYASKETPSPPSSPLSQNFLDIEDFSSIKHESDSEELNEIGSDIDFGEIIDLKTGERSLLEPKINENELDTDDKHLDEKAELNQEAKTEVKIPRKLIKGQSSYLCMHENTLETKTDQHRTYGNNYNSKITDLLQILLKRYETEGDQWRVISYRKAINAIKKYPIPITSGGEAGKIFAKGVGKAIAKKVDEILSTGKLLKIENAPVELQVLEIFMGVHGVGKTTARRWYSNGWRSLEDIKEANKSEKLQLSHDQQIGIKYYEDFKKRIPRDEVSQLADIVVKSAKDVNSNLKIYIMGSYRRGAPTCGDIDLIVTCPDGIHHIEALPKILENLKSRNPPFISDDLSTPDVQPF